MKALKQGLTFDDVLLVPHYSEVLPNEVKLETRLSKRVCISSSSSRNGRKTRSSPIRKRSLSA